MTVTRLEYGLEGIGHHLQSRRLAVPIYQRSYSWADQEVAEFWTDLHSAFLSPQSEYFLGTIVLSKEGIEGRTTIIDGQQRLATTTLLLCCLRDEFESRGDHQRASHISSEYLSKLSLRTATEDPQLTLNSDDDEYFRQFIRGQAPTAAPVNSPESHSLIYTAYSTLKGKVAAFTAGAGQAWTDKTVEFLEFVTEQATVIHVVVPTEADAFLIFETLNDRGADLTIADLLKNYLFARAGTRLSTVRDGWIRTQGILDGSAAGLVTFLRHLWSSKHGSVRERDLYSSIKSRVTTEQNVVDFVAELQTASRLYAALENSDHEFWAPHGASAKAAIESLLTLDLEQNKPLLIAAMQHLDAPELRKVLPSIVAWSVRGIVVGGIGGGTAERAYCEAAVKVRGGQVKTRDELLQELGGIVPNDADFEAAFRTARVPRARLARYYLAALEAQASNKVEPELVPNDDADKLNLEHILPRNATNADWPQFSSEERESMVHRLGNMTLLAKGPNGRIGNRAYATKKPTLAASQLVLTQEAGRPADWTAAEIQTRQDRLAALAVATWQR